jgi:hypothetical protein
MLPKISTIVCLGLALIIAQSCHKQAPQPPSSSSASQPVSPQPASAASDAADSQSPENLDPSFLDRLRKERWTGDLDALQERRYIRALVIYNKTYFFYDGPQPRGATYEALRDFEKFVNARLDTGHKPLHILLRPHRLPVSTTCREKRFI